MVFCVGMDVELTCVQGCLRPNDGTTAENYGAVVGCLRSETGVRPLLKSIRPLPEFKLSIGETIGTPSALPVIFPRKTGWLVVRSLGIGAPMTVGPDSHQTDHNFLRLDKASSAPVNKERREKGLAR